MNSFYGATSRIMLAMGDEKASFWRNLLKFDPKSGARHGQHTLLACSDHQVGLFPGKENAGPADQCIRAGIYPAPW